MVFHLRRQHGNALKLNQPVNTRTIFICFSLFKTMAVYGGTLDLDGNCFSLNGLAGNGIIDTLSGGAPTLTVGQNGNNGGVFSGAIQNTAGTLSLVVDGTNTLVFSGGNTYSGTTTINDGTLLVNGSIGLGDVTVVSPGALGGMGSLGGNVDWRPGSFASFIITNGMSFSPMIISGNVRMEGGNYVIINVAGTNSLGAGTYPLITYNRGSTCDSFDSSPIFLGAGSVGSATVSTVSNLVVLTVSSNIVVTNPIAPTNPPTITGFILANGNDIVVTGVNGDIGATYYLLTSTNIARPIAQWKTIATNVANGSNFTFTETNARTPVVSLQQFYILSSTNYNP
jgi:autotransporter-associated beta strand protein